MSTNPAYVEWVLMVKDGEEKMVHPGNVENHEQAGWKCKVPIVQTPAKPEPPTVAVETPVEQPAETPVSLDTAADVAETVVKKGRAAKKAKEEADAAEKNNDSE